MRWMIRLSLLLNVGVLVPICFSLIADAAWVEASYGPPNAARDILLSVYLAIGLMSIALLFIHDTKLVAGLLLLQIVYKLTTPVTVGTLFHPVVASNLGIAAFHAITLVLIFRPRSVWSDKLEESVPGT